MDIPFKVWFLLVFITSSLSISQGISANDNGTIKWDSQRNDIDGQTSNLNTKFDAEGLGPWYGLANSFISTVLNKEPYDIIKKAKEGKLMDDPVNNIALGYALGMAITVGIGILFCIIMPIVGLCFCCCRCCGNCGGEMTQKDDPRSGCKRAVFGVVLSIITLLMFAGVLLTFVCNDNMSKTLDKTKTTSSGIVDEMSQFINTTISEFDSIINKDFKFVSQKLLDDTSDSGIKRLLGDKFFALINSSIAEPIRAVKKLSVNSNKMKTQLEIIVNNTKDLKLFAQRLAEGLDKAKTNISQLKRDCAALNPSPTYCNNIDDNQLQQGANFSKVPDVSNQFDKVKEVTDLDFVAAAEKGLKVINDLPDSVINKTSDARSGINNMINNATDSVNKILDDLNTRANDTILKPLRDVKSLIHEYVEEGKKFDKYRWYAGVGLTCLLLLIVVLMTLGLMCGICGYDKEATPTNRGTVSNMGGNCLMAATGFCFIFSSFLMLLTTICFIIGAPMQSAVCKPIESGGIFTNIIDNKEFWGGKSPFKELFGNNSENFKLGEALDNCRDNQPAYEALKIENFYNISKHLNIKELLGDKVDQEFDQLKVNFSDKTILNNASKQSLTKLNESGVNDINFDAFLNETRQGITKVNLTEFAGKLDKFAENMTALAENVTSPEKEKAYNLAYKAGNISLDLKNLDKDVVQAMDAKSKEMDANVVELKKIGGNLAADAVSALNAAERAESQLHNSVSDITDLVRGYTNRVLGYGYQFTDHIMNLVQNHLGRCKPLTNVFDAVVVLLCKEFLYPFNGFWLGIGFCLFFFIPAIIFSVKLAKHYRRMNYESEFDEYRNGPETIEMRQPPSYQSVGNEKKLWANPK